MSDYPAMITPVNHVQPVPRRVRAVLAGQTVLDTTRARYRPLRIELDGVVLAGSSSPVMVFESGPPTRYYVNRTDVDFTHLVPSDTVTACPYKGKTSAYWSVRLGGTEHADLAWAYDFPTRQLLPISGLIAF